MPPTSSKSAPFAVRLLAATCLLALAAGGAWMLINITPWHHWRVSVPLALLTVLCTAGAALCLARPRTSPAPRK